jgi:phosphotransferase family enzyme
VSISSIAAPDLRAICRSALGRDVVASEPIGAGRNSRVFRVDLDDGSAASPRQAVVKFYRRDAGDVRDRLRTEFGSLQFLWQNGVHAIPRPMAIAPDWQCGVYEYIPGEAAGSVPFGPDDIDASVEFLRRLTQLRSAPGSGALPAASEACFSLTEVVASVDRRLARLEAAAASDGAGAMRRWLDQTCSPLRIEVGEWCRAAAQRSQIAFDDEIGPAARTLSPSDFGFHNAIRRPDGTLAFVDFEYFGWDDPAKMIVDYLLHPGMALDDRLKGRFAAGVLAVFADVPALGARARIAYPLFGLKWALILLNDFLPERFSQADGDRQAAQLGKAQALVRRVAGEYAHNPFLS